MIRMGMIGCGNMARSFLSGLAELRDRVTFTALVDLELSKAQEAAKAAPGARLATNYADIYGDVDGVIIALPHDLHHRVALDFIAAGKHVLLEKPMAITEQQCLDLVAANDASHTVLMIGYVMRFHPLWTELGRLIREKVYGECFQVSVWTEQFTDYYRLWEPQVERVGGGQLFSHGCHYIDLLLHWLGRPIEGTHVGTNFGTPWMVMEGTSNVTIKFANGALGYHMGTWGARGTRLRYSVHAHCTQGMLELEHASGTITLHRDRLGGDLPALEAALPPGATLEAPNRAIIARASSVDKATVAEIGHFCDCIERGRQPITNARMATQSLRVIWELYEAERRAEVADLRGLGLDEFGPLPDPRRGKAARG